jgi:signal transduction histidine kinase/HAMP domain-containing protein
MNIGRKLILSFLLVTFLPTLLLAFLTTNLISSSKKSDAQETINNNLKAAWVQYYARAYQMQYGMLQASTEKFIQDAMRRGDKAKLRAQLKAWKAHRPYVDMWAVVDSRSIVIASHNTAESGYLLTLGGLVNKAISQKAPFISTEIIPGSVLAIEKIDRTARVVRTVEDEGRRSAQEILDGMMLCVVTPVSDEAGNVLGAIVTGDLINNDPFVPDAFAESIPGALVTISMGDVQVATNVKDENGKRLVGHIIPADVLAGIKSQMGYRGETVIAHKPYLSAFDPVINYEARIIGSIFVGVPKERFVSLQYDNIKAVITISMIGLFLATGAASFVTYVITRPLLSLKKKAQLVASGDLNVRIGTVKEGNDEIADLARTFEVMLQSLRDHEDRIKVSQEKLATQNILIESIINSLPYSLYVLDKDMTIVLLNTHAAAACLNSKGGSSSECCRGANVLALLPGEDLKLALGEAINGVFATGEAKSLEYRVPGEGGHEKVMLTSVFPVLPGATGQAEYVVWMSEDVTRKKELESNIISSEKLAAVGQLAAGIAHEVNNPLGGILNCLYNFRHKKLTDDRKAEYIVFMEDGIKRVQNIVRQLLDFAQQHAPELKLTDVNAMIEGLIPLFGHLVKGRDVTLTTNLAQGLPPIMADKHQIEQIVVNLILNALQAVSGGGTISVRTSVEGGWFCVEVADDGCGISKENLGRVFDPFFTTKGVGKGTGLGLSVSRGIIERHKGRIEVDSQAGKGSTFRVYLPVPLQS